MAKGTESVVVDLATVLKRIRKERQLTQVQMADELGISQSYLSRLELGSRQPHKVDFLRRVGLRLDIPPEEIGLAPAWLSDSEAEELYERGLLALGASDALVAEELLGRVARGGHGVSPSPFLRAKAQLHLGHIRRDRFELQGNDGALHLYSQARAAFEEMDALSALRETCFVTGACYEMLEDIPRAEEYYQLAINLAQRRNSIQGEARSETRLGTIATKANDLEAAKTHLARSRKLSTKLDDPYPYAFATEKSAILALREGRVDEAHKLAMTARSEYSGDAMRTTQSHLVTADIALAAGDDTAAASDLQVVRDLALEHEFRHQLVAIDKLLKRHGL